MEEVDEAEDEEEVVDAGWAVMRAGLWAAASAAATAGRMEGMSSGLSGRRPLVFHRLLLTEHCTDPVCALQTHAYGFQRGPGGRLSGLQPPSECMPC